MLFAKFLSLRKRSSSPTPPKPASVRFTHQLFYPATDEPPLEHPGKQILPCGRSRSHIFLTQLNTINEENPKTKDTSAFPSTSDALKRELDSFQFYYYLPHISNHGVDFYSDQGFVAYDLGNFDAELDLPVIENGDFEYYPKSPQAKKQFHRETCQR